ncbi:MAG: DsrE family protein [Candidatus Thiodiazotropha sp. (ex. Lucinisca nassula)]|nr:DsrE family protein [Candidatus Thiodiazotropha sp. (ex. Lucinisca nassula)]
MINKSIQKRGWWGLLMGLLLFSMDSANAAEKINDAMALNGVKETRSVFLIDFTNPQKTAFYLDIIRGTHEGLVRQGVKPNMVLVFIGETVRYLSTEPDDVLAMEYGKQLDSIADTAKALKAKGVRMEVCAIANRVFEVDNATILPEMDVVGDGFISLIGWQTQGHKLVPIF